MGLAQCDWASGPALKAAKRAGSVQIHPVVLRLVVCNIFVLIDSHETRMIEISKFVWNIYDSSSHLLRIGMEIVHAHLQGCLKCLPYALCFEPKQSKEILITSRYS